MQEMADLLYESIRISDHGCNQVFTAIAVHHSHFLSQYDMARLLG